MAHTGQAKANTTAAHHAIGDGERARLGRSGALAIPVGSLDMKEKVVRLAGLLGGLPSSVVLVFKALGRGLAEDRPA